MRPDSRVPRGEVLLQVHPEGDPGAVVRPPLRPRALQVRHVTLFVRTPVCCLFSCLSFLLKKMFIHENACLCDWVKVTLPQTYVTRLLLIP